MKKKIIAISVAALMVASMALVVEAHPGRTDGRGGHTNHSTGEYHYHHGYSAHDHYDMDGDGTIDCPYDFKDKTAKQPSYNTYPKENKKEVQKETIEESQETSNWSPVLSSILSVVFRVFLKIILPWIIFIIIIRLYM